MCQITRDSYALTARLNLQLYKIFATEGVARTERVVGVSLFMS